MNAASDWWVAEKRAYGDPRLRPSHDLDRIANEQDVVLITGFVPHRSADPLVAKLRTDTSGAAIVHAAPHIYCTGWTEIQIQHPQADKGHALTDFLELTDLRGSTLLVCGNDLNDLGMFAVADHSIALANAHPAALAAATTTVSDNDADGVIQWRLRHVEVDSSREPCRTQSHRPTEKAGPSGVCEVGRRRFYRYAGCSSTGVRLDGVEASISDQPLRWRVRIEIAMSDPHDHTPDAFDAQLADAEVHVDVGDPDIEMTVTVPVAASTLTALSERAQREGRNVESVIADALRAAA